MLASPGRSQARSVARHFLTLMPRLGGLCVAALRGSGRLSFDRLRVLRALDEAPTRGGELARRWGLTPSSITLLVDELASAGLVARRADPDDRRAVVLELTAAGRNELRATEEVVIAALEEPIRALGPAGRARLEVALAELEGVLRELKPSRRSTP